MKLFIFAVIVAIILPAISIRSFFSFLEKTDSEIEID
jgi:hypothetical protein